MLSGRVHPRAARIDTPAKVKGAAEFGIDVRIPNMQYALLTRCPVIGGKVASFDDRDTKGVAGVSFVGKIGASAIAVVADSLWSAMQGRKALRVQWDEGPNSSLTSAKIMQSLQQESSGKGVPLSSRGDVKQPKGRRVEAAYQTPFDGARGDGAGKLHGVVSGREARSLGAGARPARLPEGDRRRDGSGCYACDFERDAAGRRFRTQAGARLRSRSGAGFQGLSETGEGCLDA